VFYRIKGPFLVTTGQTLGYLSNHNNDSAIHHTNLKGNTKGTFVAIFKVGHLHRDERSELEFREQRYLFAGA